MHCWKPKHTSEGLDQLRSSFYGGCWTVTERLALHQDAGASLMEQSCLSALPTVVQCQHLLAQLTSGPLLQGAHGHHAAQWL